MASWAPRRQSARPANSYLLGIRPNRKGLVGLWDPDECDRGAAAPTASRQAAASRDLHRRPGGRPDQPSPASRLACSPSRCSYQPNEQASLLAEPALVPAQRAGLYQPNEQARTSPASGSACSMGWCRYQPGDQVNLLAKLVPAPARRSGQPARRAGACASPTSRLACSPSRYSYQPNK
ncbi:hypothetical protein PCANC_23624 [Puccinia coronata f. sp. avenae]|uniref:Uncharacterized protein n=1 Tax=Puccinia coronata f. sp. avenae TaxID=200324 RepID=A0A2N5RU22_9BASI|nr:hypothetical protein PCANC_28833 [Puccinia coronata f. sp. avenae]PLW11112.1 hypothetical protein PCANC_23624 [Puccinia coronata f. sp. avenae]